MDNEKMSDNVNEYLSYYQQYSFDDFLKNDFELLDATMFVYHIYVQQRIGHFLCNEVPEEQMFDTIIRELILIGYLELSEYDIDVIKKTPLTNNEILLTVINIEKIKEKVKYNMFQTYSLILYSIAFGKYMRLIKEKYLLYKNLNNEGNNNV